ncbi:MAG: hypothetical protein QMD46_13070 [Methanomicrobiales archaeon]|nr:hypothetical protein [Methanomicrobiales archaeon]
MRGGSAIILPLLAGGSLLSIVAADLIAYLHPAQGYEFSLYGSTPALVWILLIAGAIGGIFILLCQAYLGGSGRGAPWAAALSIIVLARVSLLFVPYIRGYYSLGGDHISHMGVVRDIVALGHVESTNYYPALHILASAVTVVSGLSVEICTNCLAAVISVFYVLSIVALAHALFRTQQVNLLTFAAIGAVFNSAYHIYFMPNGWAFFLLPFVLYLIVKEIRSQEFKLLLVVSLVLFPFLHPLGSAVLLLLLLFIGIVRILHMRGVHRRLTRGMVMFNLPIKEVAVLGAIFVPWLLSFRQFHSNVRSLYYILMTGESLDKFGELAMRVEKVNLDFAGLLDLGFRSLGHNIIYITICLVGAAIIIRQYRRSREAYFPAILILGSIAFFGLVYAAYLFNIVRGLESIAAERIIPLVFILVPVIVGYTFYAFNIRGRPLRLAAVFTVICAALLISTFSLYPSPLILRPNPQITEQDVVATHWLLESRGDPAYYADIQNPLYRLADAVVGSRQANLQGIKRNVTRVPDHFNYPASPRLGETFTATRYLLSTEFDRRLYTDLYTSVGRFTHDDFERLERDASANKLYVNGEGSIWSIQPGFG